jgi:hypothetical protein
VTPHATREFLYTFSVFAAFCPPAKQVSEYYSLTIELSTTALGVLYHSTVFFLLLGEDGDPYLVMGVL